MKTLALGLGLIALLSGCRQDAFCLDCEDPSLAGSGGGGRGGGDAGGDEDGGTAGVSGDGGFVPPACEPLGDEVCNQLDDDCDGRLDEDFDFTSNPRHCGGCDRACQFDNAETGCQDSVCVMVSCLPGYVSLDADPGCEYFCPVSPTVAEDCNGIDDDCDGKIDEAAVPPDAEDFCNTLAGTPCENVNLLCDTREGRTTWFCDYPNTVQFDPIVPDGILREETLCDGNDNDCDGVVDDLWPEIGDSCDDGLIGACANGGEMRCAPDKISTACDLSLPPDAVPGAGPSAPELCNNLDDDCDGIVDNSLSTDAKRVRDDMIHIVRGPLDFYIYRYEASRPDATGVQAGISNARACSKPNALPWASVTYAAASAACSAAGLRLCSPDEWEAACEGAGANTFPYGSTYGADKCNGTNHDVAPGAPIMNAAVPSGALTECISADGAYDMSGNLKEWTNDVRVPMMGPEDIYVVRGGSFESPEYGLTCQTRLSQATEGTVLPNVGFRCCSTTAQ